MKFEFSQFEKMFVALSEAEKVIVTTNGMGTIEFDGKTIWKELNDEFNKCYKMGLKDGKGKL